MTNNTDTKAPSESWSGSFTNPMNYIIGILIGLFAAMLVTSVMLSPHEEPRPPLWTIRATVGGIGARPGVIGLTAPHVLIVSMGNYDCGLGEDELRCCHAEVAFDGFPDEEQARRLCNDLQLKAQVWTGDGVAGVSPDLLDELVGHDRFELLYGQHFGGELKNCRVSTKFVDRH